MTVKSDVAYQGDKELKKDWPIIEGLILGTTKIDKRQTNLVAQGLEHKGKLMKSNVLKRNKVMI